MRNNRRSSSVEQILSIRYYNIVHIYPDLSFNKPDETDFGTENYEHEPSFDFDE